MWRAIKNLGGQRWNQRLISIRKSKCIMPSPPSSPSPPAFQDTSPAPHNFCPPTLQPSNPAAFQPSVLHPTSAPAFQNPLAFEPSSQPSICAPAFQPSSCPGFRGQWLWRRLEGRGWKAGRSRWLGGMPELACSFVQLDCRGWLGG